MYLLRHGETEWNRAERMQGRLDAPLTARGELFSINWFVQVELDVPWAKDPKIRAPVELVPDTRRL